MTLRGSQQLIKRRCAEDSVDPYAWMFTLSDLMTLLLTAFVLRFSMLSFDTKVFKQAFPDSDLRTPTVQSDKNKVDLHDREVLFARLASEYAAERSQQNGLGSGVELYQSADGTEIVRSNEELRLKLAPGVFVDGSDELSFLGREALATLTRVIKHADFRFQVIIRLPDNSPVSSKFPNRWILARDRALRIVRQMVDSGVGAQSILTAASVDKTAQEQQFQTAKDNQKEGVEVLFFARNRNGREKI